MRYLNVTWRGHLLWLSEPELLYWADVEAAAQRKHYQPRIFFETWLLAKSNNSTRMRTA